MNLTETIQQQIDHLDPHTVANDLDHIINTTFDAIFNYTKQSHCSQADCNELLRLLVKAMNDNNIYNTETILSFIGTDLMTYDGHDLTYLQHIIDHVYLNHQYHAYCNGIINDQTSTLYQRLTNILTTFKHNSVVITKEGLKK